MQCDSSGHMVSSCFSGFIDYRFSAELNLKTYVCYRNALNWICDWQEDPVPPSFLPVCGLLAAGWWSHRLVELHTSFCSDPHLHHIT